SGTQGAALQQSGRSASGAAAGPSDLRRRATDPDASAAASAGGPVAGPSLGSQRPTAPRRRLAGRIVVPARGRRRPSSAAVGGRAGPTPLRPGTGRAAGPGRAGGRGRPAPALASRPHGDASGTRRRRRDGAGPAGGQRARRDPTLRCGPGSDRELYVV